MGVVEPGRDIANDKAVLRISPGKCRSHTDGTKNIQTGQLVILVHFAFGDAELRPAKWRLGGCGTLDAHIPNPHFIQKSLVKCIRVRERKHHEIRITRTRKSE